MNHLSTTDDGLDRSPLSLRFANLDLSSTILDATRLLKCGFRHSRLTLTVDFPGAPLVVQADARAVRGVMRRIFHSANDALDRRYAAQYVEGNAGRRPAPGHIAVRASVGPERVRILFVHNGIMPDLRGELACSDRADNLDALDVAIIRAAVERQCGSFEVDQIAEETRMTLELPRPGRR